MVMGPGCPRSPGKCPKDIGAVARQSSQKRRGQELSTDSSMGDVQGERDRSGKAPTNQTNNKPTPQKNQTATKNPTHPRHPSPNGAAGPRQKPTVQANVGPIRTEPRGRMSMLMV